MDIASCRALGSPVLCLSRLTTVTSVLLVEDEESVAAPLAVALGREGYPTDTRATAADALAALGTGSYDLVVLDLGLPDGDGLQVCREIRRRSPDLPVLILTARAEEIDIVVGLDAGADDYLTKPFRLAELFARIRALVRRSTPQPEVSFGSLRIEPGARQVWIGEQALDLPTKEFDLLSLLAQRAGSVVGRAQIAREVWNGAVPEGSRTIDTHVSALRRRLADAGGDLEISTLRGVGFRLAPV